jgi:tetratricopeptide (TPR) repeat protein
MLQNNKTPKCFVIMPIGKEGTDEYAHHFGVYNAIIRPAAEACGYTVKRADLTSETGNIPRQIITDLAEADIVIADLSERNANVYFELGIRHVLARSGTIHLVEEDKALPFDVAQYRAIKYSTHFTKIEAVQKAIQQAIREKQANPAASDNPVHDTLALPTSYLDTSSPDLRDRVKELQDEASALREENEKLRKEASLLSPRLELDETKAEKTIDEVINRSIDQIEKSPARLILQMREVAGRGQYKDLLELIRVALKSQYLEPTHIATIASLAQQQNLRSVQNAVLEVGRMRFPTDVDFKRWLAESYVHSSDADLQRKGLAILEDHLGVIWENGKVRIEKPFVDQAAISMAVIADYYHESEQYDKELTLLRAALEVWPNEGRILRNLGRAYQAMGDAQKAEESFRSAIEADPEDDRALSWFSNMLEKQARLEEAYELLVRASEVDPDDLDYLLALGIFVLEHGSIEQIKSGAKPSRQEKLSKGLPVFEMAYQKGNRNPRIAMRIADIISRFDISKAKEFLSRAGYLGDPSDE